MAKLENLINKDLLEAYDNELKKTYLAGGAVFDISAHKATGSQATPATFASLTAALGTNGANIPQNMRKGGMAVKFIKGSSQSQSNKYVQYRLTTQTFSTSEADWECIEDSVSALEQIVGTGGSVDERIAAEGARHYLKAETYTKTEVNGLVDTPHQEYVTVEHYADLPATGSADTIYRVSNWDGSANSGQGAVDATVYSEYAWDDVSSPNKYVFLCVKSLIGEVFDISVYNNNAVYADLAAALGTNGANVPESLRKGGMSVKFIQGSVQSSDNKYVQYMYMYDDATTVATFTNTVNWQRSIYDNYPTTIEERTVEIEIGTIDYSGNDKVNEKRRRTGPIYLNNFYEAGVTDHKKYKFAVRVYNSNGCLGSGNGGNWYNTNVLSADILSEYPTATYIRFMIGESNEDVTGWDDLEVVYQQITKVNKSIFELFKPLFMSDTKEQPVDIEYGGLTATGAIEDYSQRSTFFTKYRTGKFIKKNSFNLILTNCNAEVYEYNADFGFIGKRSVTTSYSPSSLCAYLKISGTITDPSLPYSVKLYAGEIEEVFNNYIDENTVSFVYEFTPANGRSVLDDDASISQYDNTKYYNTGILRLPPSYRETGTPTRLIFWPHASGGYGNIYGHDWETAYLPFLNYLQKEGYALFDCYAYGSKYTSNVWINSMGTPTNMACINAAYKWVVKNYNVCTDGIYVGGKSLAGLVEANMLYNKAIPVLAIGMLAPELDPRHIRMGYNITNREIFCEDMGFINYNSILVDSPAVADIKSVCAANIDNLLSYCGALVSVIEDKNTLASLYVRDNGFSALKKICSTPVKIWIAPDDETVRFSGARNFIQAIKNIGGDAELRTMPSGTGGHHAVDRDTESGTPLKVASITTKLGYVCENVPLAFAELVQFYRKY